MFQLKLQLVLCQYNELDDEVHLYVVDKTTAPEGSIASDKGRYEFIIHSQENLDDALKLFDGSREL